jgi:hypothetical protein
VDRASLSLSLTALPHLLGSLKKSPKSFIICSYEKCACNPFRICSYKTLDLKSFAISSYRKRGGIYPCRGPTFSIQRRLRHSAGWDRIRREDESGNAFSDGLGTSELRAVARA